MPSLLDALIQQESSGRPGILGPRTQYGRAMGLTQVMPGTGAEMAQKLGIPWRPDLMTAKTDEGAEYQRRIGEAYLQEGFEKTGNVRDALRYYHGGPDRKMWGPKTNAYAEEVLARAGNPQPMPIQPYSPMPRPQEMLNDQPVDVLGQGSLAELMQLSPVSAAPEVKPRAFDKGGKGWVIAGIIADAIAGGFGGRGGFAPTFLAMQEDERNAERQRMEYQRSREDRMEDARIMLQRQIALEDYKRANPEPPNPTNAAKMLIERGFTPGTPEFQRELGRYMNRPIMIGGQPYGYEDGGGETRSVVRTGTDADGRRVVQYSDGSIDYAD